MKHEQYGDMLQKLLDNMSKIIDESQSASDNERSHADSDNDDDFVKKPEIIIKEKPKQINSGVNECKPIKIIKVVKNTKI